MSLWRRCAWDKGKGIDDVGGAAVVVVLRHFQTLGPTGVHGEEKLVKENEMKDMNSVRGLLTKLGRFLLRWARQLMKYLTEVLFTAGWLGE